MCICTEDMNGCRFPRERSLRYIHAMFHYKYLPKGSLSFFPFSTLSRSFLDYGTESSSTIYFGNENTVNFRSHAGAVVAEDPVSKGCSGESSQHQINCTSVKETFGFIRIMFRSGWFRGPETLMTAGREDTLIYGDTGVDFIGY